MYKALENARCGLGGYHRSFRRVSPLPLKLLSVGWFVSTVKFNLSNMEISCRLTAQLKVNLRPLWPPTMKALSELSIRCDSVVWSSILGDLRLLTEGRSLELSPEWVKEPLFEVGDVIQEEEHTWQDPSAHKMRIAVSSWTSEQVPRQKIVKVCHSFQGPL